MSPEPEELVTPPKPLVRYSPLEGVAVQSALAADEVDVELVGEGVIVEVVDSMVDVVDSMVEVVGAMVKVVGATVEVEVVHWIVEVDVHSMEEDQIEVEVVKASEDDGVGEGTVRRLEDEASQGQLMIVESVVTVTVLSWASA